MLGTGEDRKKEGFLEVQGCKPKFLPLKTAGKGVLSPHPQFS